MEEKQGQIGIVILAAGGSSRMGEQKLVKPFAGSTVVRRAAQTALACEAGPVVVVVGSDREAVEAELAGLPVHVARNEAWQQGQASSVVCGIAALTGCEAAILMTADQPFVTTDDLQRLIWVFREARPVIAASVCGGLPGNPALFAAELFGELKGLLGDRGAKQLFARYPVRAVEQPDPWFFTDVDTSEMFEAAEREWRLRYGWKGDFPLLMEQAELAYLDSAASSQIAEPVLAAMEQYERTSRANVHRGLYPLAERSDEAYEEARETAARFFGIRPEETIFTHGATESLNLAVFGWGGACLKTGDLVLVDMASHHANLVPWQVLAKRIGLRLVFLPLDAAGRIDREAYREWMKLGPKAVALTHVSNVTGWEEDITSLAAEAHAAGAVVIADCAQSAGHGPLCLPELGVDFAAVSAHKMYGPFGVGLLWASPRVIAEMEPLLYGGGMIERVTKEAVRFAGAPACFEAGTPNIAGAVGFAAACRYLEGMGLEQIREHGRALVRFAEKGLRQISGVRIVGGSGPAQEAAGSDGADASHAACVRSSLLSFTVDGVHPHDLAEALAAQGVCVRAGHHCAMPLHRELGLPASVRASFGIYSTRSDVERLVRAVKEAKEAFDSYE